MMKEPEEKEAHTSLSDHNHPHALALEKIQRQPEIEFIDKSQDFSDSRKIVCFAQNAG